MPNMKIPFSPNKPAITIGLQGEQQDAFVPSYTTLDKIQGEATIIAPYDTSFDQIYITLEGSTKTFVDKISTTSPTNNRTGAFQVFLRLAQPLDMEIFSESRVIKAGRTYRFPFTFVVPRKLLPQSCKHTHGSGDVQNVHLHLPPSLGDPMIASQNKTLLDDMSPEMAVISYAIKVRITRGQGTTGKPIIAAEQSKKLRIVPAVDEEPPLLMYGGTNGGYRLRKEKELTKGFFKGKLGTLTVESAQPKSLRLPAPNSSGTCPITTMATVNVRFDPFEEDAKTPRLSTLTTKLKVATFFSSVPMSELPSNMTALDYSSTRGVYVETIPLSSRCVASAQWKRHAPHTSHAPIGQDSASSTLCTPAIAAPSASRGAKCFYTAQILVPITLPRSSKVFVPTFHSCLVSRLYTLDLQLAIHSPSPAVTHPTVHLKLPIQISSEGNPDPSPSITAEEGEAFSAGSFALPSPQYSEISRSSSPSLPSPEYSELDQLDQIRLPNSGVRVQTQSRASSEDRTSSWHSELPPSYTGMLYGIAAG